MANILHLHTHCQIYMIFSIIKSRRTRTRTRTRTRHDRGGVQTMWTTPKLPDMFFETFL